MSKGNREPLFYEFQMEVRKHQNATELFDDMAVARLGINRTDGRCLDIIQQHGSMTAGDLATATGVSPGAITNILDRMEAAGFLRRVRDTADRRKITVELTEEAVRRTWEIYGPLARWSQTELGRYSDAELRFVIDFLRRGRLFLEEYVAKVRAGASAAAAPKAKAPKRKRGPAPSR